ncbi:ankyrin repeat-containing protein BDA1-like [Syzygium oleosum]|uniref:ankyrin repeat-containing protein BDA1-like n=1 Tax=Syzygium oleosum TaxID=219896 RepID=UPI0024B9A7F0|nr:ankyrin repeat-containing protein BDA1-like [Syzygium oleosum]
MDPRLLEAAQTGNVGLLNDLIRSNKLILEEAALQGAGHTPLHVACVAGHLNFVRELLKLMPKLAENMNADGFSPLHIAAARGDVEIVREILKAGRPQHLCLVKGRERIIPLHCAATNGKVGAMKELLSASPESVEETTAREETALHLSVKNNRFDTLVVLVEHLKQHNKEQVINWQDKKGDTILHLAAAAKNFEVVDFMLSGHALAREVVEVNALNDSGSTPLDVSSRSDREIRETLMRAGAKHGPSNLPSSQIVLVDDEEDDIKRATSYQSVMKAAVENNHPPLSTPEGSNQGQESLGDIRSTLLVVATLIASATYQAVLQPPSFTPMAESSTKKGFLAAYASFMTSAFMRDLNYLSFMSGNTFGFLVSVQMIICLTRDLPMRLPLILSTSAMVYSYFCFMWYMPFSDSLGKKFSLISEALLGNLPMAISVFLLLIQKKIAPVLDFCIQCLSWITMPSDMYSLRKVSSRDRDGISLSFEGFAKKCKQCWNRVC